MVTSRTKNESQGKGRAAAGFGSTTQSRSIEKGALYDYEVFVVRRRPGDGQLYRGQR
jgi:hypothetical protein